MKKTYELFHIKDDSRTKNYVYFIVDKRTKEAAIIDPACKIKDISRAVEQYQLNVTTVLITHTHEDHIRSVEDVVNRYDVPVYVSKVEAETYDFSNKNIEYVYDMDRLYIGDTEITCLLTPGHSAGSLCYYLSHSIFTGDTIFIEGCGICGAYEGSAQDMYQSIQRIDQMVDDSIYVYPGHAYKNFPGKTMGFVKKNNIYFHFDTQVDFANFRLRKNQKGLFDFI